MANLVLKISSGLTKQNLQDSLSFNSNKNQPRKFLESFAKALDDNSKIEIQLLNGDPVKATGTFTFTGAATADDTVLINGVTFTAKASGAGANEFNIGLDETATAANLAASIVASTTALIAGYVKATSALGVTTMTAVTPGLAGNLMTIAVGVDFGTVNTASGARLTGGLEDTAASKATKAW